MTTPKLFWLFSLAILLVQASLAFSDLPDQMVTHMDLNGTPDGYGSKDEFFLAMGLAVLVINIMPPLVPLLLKRLPESLVNLPNKEYWFAEVSRKSEAFDRMFNMMAITMGMVNGMFILVLQQVIDLSTNRPSALPVWLIWCVIPLLILFPLFYMFHAFRVPEK